MDHGARQVTWLAVSAAVEDSANNETIAASVMKQSAVFIDDGDVHKLMRVLRNADGSGTPSDHSLFSRVQQCPLYADSLVVASLREKFQRGVVSGSGGGAAILSGAPLPISGHSYEALVYLRPDFIPFTFYNFSLCKQTRH